MGKTSELVLSLFSLTVFALLSMAFWLPIGKLKSIETVSGLAFGLSVILAVGSATWVLQVIGRRATK